jgi:hypothetical protein
LDRVSGYEPGGREFESLRARFKNLEHSHRATHIAPVAQLDRVSGFEPGGREFESLRARLESFFTLTQLHHPSPLVGQNGRTAILHDRRSPEGRAIG